MLSNLGKCTAGIAFAGAMVLASAQAARADIIVNDPVVTGTGPYTWTYAVDLTTGENADSTGASPIGQATTPGGQGVSSSLYDDYFTIYDFQGYVAGSIFAPAGWTTAVQFVGPTPVDEVATDDPNIVNLVFALSTGIIGGPTPLGSFGAQSIYSGTTLANYTSSATDNRGPLTAGLTDDKHASLPGPATAIPEPASMLLFGAGLVGAARQIRRRMTA